MTRLHLFAVLVVAILCTGVYARDLTAPKSMDAQMKTYQELIKNDPQNVQAINKLAYVYIRRVRQTVDFSYNVSAEKLLRQALTIAPQNYDSLLYLAIVQMSQHRFAEARDLSLRAIAVNSYGSGAYGILGDAYYELGAYEQCVDAYDKMGDLKPGAPYYARASSYRTIAGDPEEAIEFMKEALEASNPEDPEDYSWYLLQLGNLAFESGKTREAESYFQQSIQLNPVSYNAFAGLARVKAAQSDMEEAIALYEKAIAIVPMPEFAAALGDIYTSLDRRAEAEKQYALVEYIGKISKMNQEIHNRQIALFYADHGRNLEEGLKLAQNEIAIRKDVYGYDTLAWCLYKNGRIEEAVSAIKEALRMKTRDAKLMYHAGMIYAAAGRPAEASAYLKKALSIQSQFHPLYARTAEEMIRKTTAKRS